MQSLVKFIDRFNMQKDSSTEQQKIIKQLKESLNIKSKESREHNIQMESTLESIRVELNQKSNENKELVEAMYILQSEKQSLEVPILSMIFTARLKYLI